MTEDRPPTRQERRALERTIALRSHDEQALVSIRVGLCYPDDAPATRRRLHDDLIAAHPVRSGPVEWTHHSTSDHAELRRVLRLARHDTPNVWNYVILHPGCILVVAMVPVPVAGPEAVA